MTMKLYHCANARSFRALWALEETKAPYELVMMPFPPRARFPGYLDLNPLGTVPVFFDGEMRMTESAAIAQYVAVKHGAGTLAVSPEEPAYGEWLNWLHHGEATLTFPQTIVLRYTVLEPPEKRIPQAAEDYAKWFVARLRMAEQRLGDHEFLCADRFTAADISVAYALLLATTLKLGDRFGPNVRAYWERMQQRPGYLAAQAAQKAPVAASA